MLKIVGEKEGVSPVIAVILMVAITVVLSGLIYYWVSQFSTSSEKELAYIGFHKSTIDEDWIITIEKVQGTRLKLENLYFFIADVSGVVKYRKTTTEANPAAFLNDESMIYPIPSNASGVISSKTSLPVGASDDLPDYVGAVYVIIDTDNNGILNTGDIIRIHHDIDGDGTREINMGSYFKISNIGGTQEYLKAHL